MADIGLTKGYMGIYIFRNIPCYRDTTNINGCYQDVHALGFPRYRVSFLRVAYRMDYSKKRSTWGLRYGPPVC